jgi:hypothetical protein
MNITLAKGGTAERSVPLGDIRIPDLLHIANSLNDPSRDAVLECWHLAHDLLNALHVADIENGLLKANAAKMARALRNLAHTVECEPKGSPNIHAAIQESYSTLAQWEAA